MYVKADVYIQYSVCICNNRGVLFHFDPNDEIIKGNNMNFLLLGSSGRKSALLSFLKDIHWPFYKLQLAGTGLDPILP